MKQRMILRRFPIDVASVFTTRCASLSFTVLGCVFLSLPLPAFAQKWQTYTLDECIKTAIDNSPVLKLAQEKISESTAKFKETKTYFLPKVTATAFVTQLDEPAYLDMSKWYDAMGSIATPVGWLAWKDYATTGDTLAWNAFQEYMDTTTGSNTKYPLSGDKVYNMALTVVQPIFTGFRILSGKKAAQNALKAVKEEKVKARRDIILDVKKHFFSILQTQQLVVVCDTAIHQLEQIVHDLENMKETGFVGDQEVMNASVMLYNIQLMKIKAENGVILLKSVLCNSMGIDWNTPIILNHALTEPADMGVTDLPSLVDKAQKMQSEIKALEYRREALKNMVAFTKSNYYPALYAM
jgi:outer membrane protein TolC